MAMAVELTLQECLEALRTNEKAALDQAIQGLVRIIDVILFHYNKYTTEKYILDSNDLKDIFPVLGGVEILYAIGFKENSGNTFIFSWDWEKLDLMVACKEELLQIASDVFPRIYEGDNIRPNTEAEHALRLELERHQRQMLFSELPPLQDKAKAVIPMKRLNQEALEKYDKIKEKNLCTLKDCFLVCLMSWFKGEFFTWYDSGFCENCGQRMELLRSTDCNRLERECLGHRTEIHGCKKCSKQERFPRYFYPGILLKTRKGRCMEWASCFMLMCRSLGYDTRYIVDKTDHVWNEIYFESQKRWVHADPCENKVDAPLMYEKGWNKKLAYVFAYSREEVLDCVWKYSAQHSDVNKRRINYREAFVATTVQSINDKSQAKIPDEERKNFVLKRTVNEIVSYFKPPSSEDDFEGRSSGSLAWRLSRGEMTTLESLTKFVFSPTAQEVEKREMIVQYSIIDDCYITNEASSGQKWNDCVFEAKNIYRNYEDDWKNFYLTRTEGSEEGTIKWKFDWSNTELKFESLSIDFSHKTFESGLVQWQICSQIFCFPGSPSGKLELTSSDLSSDTTSFDLCCELRGGRGPVRWQHAQLFRRNESEKTSIPFVVKIKFQN